MEDERNNAARAAAAPAAAAPPLATHSLHLGKAIYPSKDFGIVLQVCDAGIQISNGEWSNPYCGIQKWRPIFEAKIGNEAVQAGDVLLIFSQFQLNNPCTFGVEAGHKCTVNRSEAAPCYPAGENCMPCYPNSQRSTFRSLVGICEIKAGNDRCPCGCQYPVHVEIWASAACGVSRISQDPKAYLVPLQGGGFSLPYIYANNGGLAVCVLKAQSPSLQQLDCFESEKMEGCVLSPPGNIPIGDYSSTARGQFTTVYTYPHRRLQQQLPPKRELICQSGDIVLAVAQLELTYEQHNKVEIAQYLYHQAPALDETSADGPSELAKVPIFPAVPSGDYADEQRIKHHLFRFVHGGFTAQRSGAYQVGLCVRALYPKPEQLKHKSIQVGDGATCQGYGGIALCVLRQARGAFFSSECVESEFVNGQVESVIYHTTIDLPSAPCLVVVQGQLQLSVDEGPAAVAQQLRVVGPACGPHQIVQPCVTAGETCDAGSFYLKSIGGVLRLERTEKVQIELVVTAKPLLSSGTAKLHLMKGQGGISVMILPV